MGLIAVFDFDGTLIEKDSMVLLLRRYFYFTSGNLAGLVRLLYHSIKYFLKFYSRKQFKEIYLNHVTGLSRMESTEDLFKDFSGYLVGSVFKEAARKIEEFNKRGYRTILLSASPDLYLKEVGRTLGFSELICTCAVCGENRISIQGPNCYGKNKIKMLLQKHGKDTVDWVNSFCYSDSESDRELLALFGNPYIVNNKRFARKYPDFKNVTWK